MDRRRFLGLGMGVIGTAGVTSTVGPNIGMPVAEAAQDAGRMAARRSNPYQL